MVALRGVVPPILVKHVLQRRQRKYVPFGYQLFFAWARVSAKSVGFESSWKRASSSDASMGFVASAHQVKSSKNPPVMK
jgi:hypothetical protein